MPDPLVEEEICAEPAVPAGSEPSFSLINPSTGLANDYLNVFNEILLVLEFLPSMPEMTEEVLAWQPRGYCEYFQQSTLPGALQALQAYDQVDPLMRRRFEAVLARLTDIVVQAQRTLAAESESPDFPDSIAKSCELTAEAMRVGLSYVSRLINEGLTPPRRAAHASKSSEERNLSHG